jgi:hypothetical protein
MLGGGVASLVMAGLYRPALVLMHDGGIFANAVSLSLVPAAVAGVLALGSRALRYAPARAWARPSPEPSGAIRARPRPSP